MNFDWGKVGLGTVQWGMNYGISGSGVKTSCADVCNILSFARKTGIRLIDTASLYGEAESVLGRQNLDNFLVVTKTPRFAQPEIYSKDADKLVVDFKKSLSLLKQGHIYGLLIHHVDDLLASGGELLIDALISLREHGLVEKIGASIYDPNILETLCERIDLDVVQLPLNVFDQRAISNGSLDLLHESGVEVHARSAFLQGLLLMPLCDVHQYFSKWYNVLAAWHYRCESFEITPLQAALGFVVGQNTVDYCVVGVNSLRQLEEIYVASTSQFDFDYSEFSIEDEALVNPMNWSLSE